MSDENSEDTNIRVAVRCRPFNTKEKQNNEKSCVRIQKDQVVLINPSGNNEEHSFAFDIVVDENWTQESVWEMLGLPTLNKAFSGYNGTIFAYGQTGSGKTWSMQGADGADGQLRGIIPRMSANLFEKISTEKKTRPGVLFLVTVSYFEIYNEVIFDLLDTSDKRKKLGAKAGLEIKEHPALGVYVKGLQEIVVDSSEKLQSIIDQGMGCRTVASTQMNADSSRSHSVFVILIHQKDAEDETKNVFAKVNLVDLAGSERVKSTGASGATLKEGANINKSLSALGNVINALVEAGKGKGTFIPYRNSKLTRVLQESLGGNSITSMLAALSPAACNFEETLSTLKYANRAKAIKVKAVKNEEASQISKLNEEIRLLKEKLMGQAHGADNNAGVSISDDKHKQQLKELEEAMKSTWEEKAKISQDYEKDRLRMIQEQKNAAKQLQTAKERNWKLLEDKGDLDLSINHVKGISKKFFAIASALDHWYKALAEITGKTQELTELDTVTQVYRSSIEKDSSALIKCVTQTSSRAPVSGNNGVSIEGAAIGLLRQLKDKLAAVKTESSKWTKLQDIMTDLLSKLLSSLENYQDRERIKTLLVENVAKSNIEDGSEVNESLNSDEDDIVRGLQLLFRQVKKKKENLQESIDKSRKKFVNFTSIAQDLVDVLSKYQSVVESAGLLLGSNTEDEMTENEVKQLSMKTILTNRLQDCHERIHVLLSANTPESNSINSQTNKNVKSYDDVIRDALVLSSKSNKDIKEDVHNQQFISNYDIGSENMLQLVEKDEIVFSFAKATIVSELTLQGGKVIVTKPNDKYDEKKCNKSESKLPINPVVEEDRNSHGGSSNDMTNYNNIVLPCGLSLSTMNGEDLSLTAKGLGESIDWVTLLKKNPPEKFLKRPPVRFIFDVIKFISISNPGFLSNNLESSAWEEVGEDKVSKVKFMEEIIRFVCDNLNVDSPTTPQAIVTGNDPEKTNELLQELGIALYIHRNKNGLASDGKSKTNLSSYKSSEKLSKLGDNRGSRSSKAEPKEIVEVIETWPLEVSVAFSIDNKNWESATNHTTQLSDAAGQFIIPLKGEDKITSKFMKIIVMKCSAKVADVAGMCAIRLQLKETIEVNSDSDDQNSPRICTIDSAKVLDTLVELSACLETLIAAANFITAVEDIIKLRKQEEVKKNLEVLAKEKQALEQLLESEKQTLANDKQDLSDQLKKCYAQLRETKSLFEREQELNNQLQNAAKQLEEEKSAMSISNQQKDDEIAELKAELLKLQANQERDKSLIEQQNQKLLENNNIIDNFDSEIKGLKDYIASLETEKDDMQNQVLVLTEERDAARTQEEDLFEKLNERTNDLERLQESYVDINDRCNDAQDELADLRDKLEYYQQALATRAELLSAPTSVGNSFDYGSNSKANIESVRPSSSGGVVNDKKVLKSTSVASTRSEENLKLSSEELNVNNNNSSSGIAMKTETNDEDDYYDDYEDEFED